MALSCLQRLSDKGVSVLVLDEAAIEIRQHSFRTSKPSAVAHYAYLFILQLREQIEDRPLPSVLTDALLKPVDAALRAFDELNIGPVADSNIVMAIERIHNSAIEAKGLLEHQK